MTFDSSKASFGRRFLAAARPPLVAFIGTAALAQAPSDTKPILYGKSFITEKESAFGTGGSDQTPYHALVYYANEHSLISKGIVVGIEKSKNKDIVAAARRQGMLSSSEVVQDKPGTERWLRDLLISRTDSSRRRSMFISHVASFPGRASDKEARLVFDAYAPTSIAESAFQDSWIAVKTVKETLAAALKAEKYTHVLVIVMGWNTQQIEAVQNYNSIYLGLRKAAGAADFNPYIIGVTWPSEWDKGYLPEAVAHAASLFNKADDADEIAASWLGVLFQDAIYPAMAGTGVPLDVIGHSFGGRAATHAVCRGTIYAPKDEAGLARASASKPQVDWLISLEGAYSLNRFTADGAGGRAKLSYGECPAASSLVFTASKHDSAGKYADYIREAPWAGSDAMFQKIEKNEGLLGRDGLRVSMHQADRGGNVSTLKGASESECRSRAARLHFVDTTDLMIYQSYGTGGGAHSDIYRPVMGSFLYSVLTGTAKGLGKCQ